MITHVLFELRLKPNVGWWLDAYPGDDPNEIDRPEDCFYPSKGEAQKAGERWAKRLYPDADLEFREGDHIPHYR